MARPNPFSERLFEGLSLGAVDKLRTAWEMLEQPIVLAGDHLADEIRDGRGLADLDGLQVVSMGDLRRHEGDAEHHEAGLDDRHPEVVTVLAFVCRRIPKCPDPDLSLVWN